MKKIFTLICGFALCYTVSAQTTPVSAIKKDNIKVKPIEKSESPSQTQPLKITPVTSVITNAAVKPVEENIALKETEFDFGKIPQGKPVTHVFSFTNIGKTPLTLENVQATCGCTTPEWNKDPVPAGATSKITVGYNAATEGLFTKNITVTYNGSQTKQITIKGEVWKTPSTSAPENSALGTLKKQQ